MDQVAFIVWRESVEALLVVGILYTWLRASPRGRRGLPWLWGGVLAGLVIAGMLALVLLGVSVWLSDEAQEWFQGGMALVAAVLVVQMVYWMKCHGASLKKTLQRDVDHELTRDNWWGVFALVAIAVAREGSETVVFLYGTVMAGIARGTGWSLAVAGVAGFLAALFSFWLLQLGGKLITWRRFFAFTQVVLLLLASSLLISGTDHLISLEAMPTLVDPVWDSSWLIDTSGGPGKVLANFAGYRAYPALSQVVVWVLYWLAIWSLLRRADQVATRGRLAVRPT